MGVRKGGVRSLNWVKLSMKWKRLTITARAVETFSYGGRSTSSQAVEDLLLSANTGYPLEFSLWLKRCVFKRACRSSLSWSRAAWTSLERSVVWPHLCRMSYSMAHCPRASLAMLPQKSFVRPLEMCPRAEESVNLSTSVPVLFNPFHINLFIYWALIEPQEPPFEDI